MFLVEFRPSSLDLINNKFLLMIEVFFWHTFSAAFIPQCVKAKDLLYKSKICTTDYGRPERK